MVDPMVAVAAAGSIGLAALGAGYAIAACGSASVGAIAEKPDLFGKTMVYVAFAEAIAIYGLLISFMLLFNIGG
jgi:V/A-type H+/Na+-transporting ATPase subunit K